MIILGIETSCDETSAALYHSENGLLAHALFSQIELHQRFGGVMPEIASRSQLEKITPIMAKVFEDSGIALDAIDAIAVTTKPGLPGSLLVGLCFAKALAWALKKPLIGVNHLEGHIFSSCIEHRVPFPHLSITASGGHTSLCLVKDFGKYAMLGVTQDDAAGEAFDKIAKLIGLPYPGGPHIERYAQKVNFEDFYSYPRGKKDTLQFSFSGLKTAVLYDLISRGAYDASTKQFLKHDDVQLQERIASSLLVCIADIFLQKLNLAHQEHAYIRAVTFVGGVACNAYIRKRIQQWCIERDMLFFAPSPRFCTDNGAMIAFVGSYLAKQKSFSPLTLDIL